MGAACIIVNYNDPETTIAQMTRIRDYRSLEWIVVVDNASADDSAARITECLRALPGFSAADPENAPGSFQVGCRVVRNRDTEKAVGKEAQRSREIWLLEASRNGGYGAGNNLGIRFAREVLGAAYCLIANPDAEFTDACAAALVRTMRQNQHQHQYQHPALGVLAPVMKNPALPFRAGVPGTRENTISGPAAWPLRGWLYDLLESGPVSRRVFRGILHYPRWRYVGRKLVPADCVPGSLLLVDAEKFLAAGGYDENVFLYEEEYILGQRMRRHGYRTALLTEVSYLHRHGESIGKSYDTLLRRQRLREAASLYYYRQYLGASPLQMALTRLFYAAVRTELRIAERTLNG